MFKAFESEVLIMEEVQQQEIAILSDSQAAIKALENSTVRSQIVLCCIENLNHLGKENRISIS